LIKIIFPLLSLMILTSCWKTRWSEKERNEFSENCSKQTYFDAGLISFTGFEFKEIDTIEVIEKRHLEIIDTIYIIIDKHRHNKGNKRYMGRTDTQFNVNHSYEFILGNEKPYVLDNMEMIMWAQFTMLSEGWGCVMGKFTIDNKKYEHRSSIDIVKRDFEYFN